MTINLEDKDGPLLHSLQAHFGKSFNLATFTAEQFSAPYANCTLCGKRITVSPVDMEVATGYVRLTVIEQLPPELEYLQWDWVCQECFSRYQSVSNWSVVEGGVDSISRDRFRKFKEDVRFRRELEDPPPPNRYELQVTWNPEEIVAIARLLGLNLTDEEASKLLWRNRRRLMGAMDSSAFDIVSKILQRDVKRSVSV